MSARFVVGKVLGAAATLAFVVVFNFFLFRIVSGDPVATLFRGRNLTDAQRDRLTQEFGLDGSIWEQFFRYLEQTVQLNFGRSYTTNQPVVGEIWEAAPATIALVGVSAILAMALGLVAGVVSAWHRGTWKDTSLTSGSMVTWSMPDFWLGMLLLTWLAVGLGLFPTGGISDPGAGGGFSGLLDQVHHMALPALTLTLAYFGEYALVMRSSLLDTMREDYLVLARAKGLRDVEVRNRHAVRNALLPSVTLIAINFGFVLSGAIAVETVFSWPGLGLLTYDSIRGPDLPMLQGLFLFFSASVILFNLAAELVYPVLDPRVRR
ncbi:MAG TPA: ABC transporter permease [Gaiellaceae bacterium]|jgi:peptide/nickel transport system permease protein|nr:ABC transporter permease [Gaiellaceae bacterium]